MKRKKSKPIQIGEILREAMRKRQIPVEYCDSALSQAWQKAVGPVIYNQTRPERIKNRTLYVKVSSSVWMQQLQYMKSGPGCKN